MIALNYRDSRPIYRQIKDGLRKLIITGAMPAGEKLQSVRSLAVELSINPNTIQRAYNELEAEGYIYSIAAKGSFVADLLPGGTDTRTKELTERLTEILSELQYHGMPLSDVQALVKEMWDHTAQELADDGNKAELMEEKNDTD